MGESPQSEPRDGRTRPAEAEERAPREGGSTVHLRARDTDEPATSPESDLDLPEAGAALTAAKPKEEEKGKEKEEEGAEAAEAEDAPEGEAESVPAAPEPTMTLRVEKSAKSEKPEEPEAEKAEKSEKAEGPETEKAEKAEGPETEKAEEPEAEEPESEEPEAEEAVPAASELTMTLRIEKVEEAEEKSVPAAPEPTMTLRIGKAEKAEEPEAEEASAPAVSEPTMTLRMEKVEEAEEKSVPAAPEPTMTLRIGKPETAEKSDEADEASAGPEQTVMLRLPKDESAPKPAPKPKPALKPAPAPKAAPAAAAPVAAPVVTAPAPAPVGPESTVEALEVLKALSARPMTPFRRAMKRVVIWGVFLVVVFGVLAAVQLLRPLPAPKAKLGLADSFTFQGEQLSIPWPAKGQAAAEVVGVGDLGASGEQTPVPIASVTKVMNAYLILQAHPLKKGQSGPMLTVDKQAAQESSNADESKVTLTEGQQISQYEALEMLMLPSANNVARLLARWDSGSEEAFIKKMNDTAKQFGMTNTTYADPAGYNNDTKSTAKDQLKLAEQVMKDEIFRQVIAEPDTKFNGQRVYNTNKVLGKNGMIGGKTGSSTPAQSCFMWAAVKEIGGVKRTLLGVTLGQPATKEEPSLVNAAQPVSQKINVAAQSALTGQTLAKQGDVVGFVDDGVGGKVPVVASKDLTVAGWSGITAHLTLTPIGKIAHTLPAGTQVGTLSAGDGDDRIEVPVTLRSDLAPPSISSRLLRLG
ncbi:D-alanyl-D-alanine carboxypeptidase family protein [Kitasatospora griseola]|uniref:D-alanyl-D-alanine carboxypeptidase family protein n=1 Tax=Kitasatospora griseola TaxID=2064 RepID=UPI0016713395|nr:D-alanyl-D-alanine carboxypeptidase [Kitasatospora griseola]GGQ75344.1 hypothetical protein GCM10010195_33730 [Kitasatospora griseola]